MASPLNFLGRCKIPSKKPSASLFVHGRGQSGAVHPMEFENDDVIWCFRAKYPTIFALTFNSMLASYCPKFALQRRKIATIFALSMARRIMDQFAVQAVVLPSGKIPAELLAKCRE